jgi:hypothetical protein
MWLLELVPRSLFGQDYQISPRHTTGKAKSISTSFSVVVPLRVHDISIVAST